MHSTTPKQTILVVDDDPDLQQFFAEAFFGDEEFELVQATDGEKGLAIAQTQLPACIIIDVSMPSLDGYQLVRVLRGDIETASIPLIILTALHRADGPRTADLSGADAYLDKPILFEELLPVMRDVMQKSDDARMERMRQLVELSDE